MNDNSFSKKYNFTWIHDHESSELGCTIRIFEHDKLKNKLIFIESDDENKCFCAGFKTPPADSTGVPHILEHSVLSGSKKYPIKDVFAELVKGSLTTFLNAMTYSDKTLYPFSTRNEKEFFNLMDVYLDLTLNPLLDEDTFMQEGWHYKLKDLNSALTYNGIVLNEMKGVFSDPVRKIWEKITAYLFPGSTFANCSGGDPEAIPALTYENFVNFHKRYYHPANGAVAVYGNVSIEKVMEKLDSEYFQKFEYRNPEAKIEKGDAIQEPVFLKDTYEAGEGAEPLSYVALGIDTGEITTVEHNIAMEMLTNILFNSDGSMLKRDLLKAGVGSEIGCIYNDTLMSFLFIYVIGAGEKSKDALVKTYTESLQDLVKNGLPRDLVLSEINSYEFHKKELVSSAKRGMDFTIEAMSSLMYGLDIAGSLETENILKKIREEALNNRYFEKLMERLLLKNNKTVLYSMSPAEMKEKDSPEKLRLAKIKESMSDGELKKIIEKAATLEKKQAEPNPEEKLKTLPRLALSDVKPNFEKLNLETEKVADVDFIITPNDTKGIHHVNLGFKTDHIDQSLLPYITIYGQVLTEIGTKSRNYMELAKFINTYTGGLSSGFTCYSHKEDTQAYSPYLWFNIKFLEAYQSEAFDVLNDVFQNTLFSNTDRLSEIMDRTLAALQYNITSEGYYIPVSRVSAYISTRGAYNELVDGYTSYRELMQWKGKKGDELEGLVQILKKIHESLLNRKNALAHFTAPSDQTEILKKKVHEIVQGLPAADSSVLDLRLPEFLPNQAFSTPADVVYAVLGGNIFEAGLPYSGQLEVLRKFLDRDYLYNQIRVIGGAYGNFSRLNRFNGNLIFISYRDPHIASTFDAFRNIPKTIRDLNITDYALDQIKISAYNSFDPLLSAAQKGSKAKNDYIHGLTPEDTEKTVYEILSTTPADLKNMAGAFEAFMQKAVISIIGSDRKIQKEKDRFSEIIAI